MTKVWVGSATAQVAPTGWLEELTTMVAGSAWRSRMSDAFCAAYSHGCDAAG